MLWSARTIVLNALVASPICFFFNDTATTEIYTLSLHDALPIFILDIRMPGVTGLELAQMIKARKKTASVRSEEHTSELQSHLNLVCRLLLEKKNRSNRTAQL